MTVAERKLWSLLRKNQLGVRFRRQVPLHGYVLDFYCPKAKLDVELDGSQHYTSQGVRKDKERDNDLQREGIAVLRFASSEVFQNLEGVIQAIINVTEEQIAQKKNLSPS
ncbi:MAG: endonuclease domain-containing protein [Ignavibacteriae bacterium]|nr:endonuclease domain-containing protein [Ignavibacteriota bacterium]